MLCVIIAELFQLHTHRHTSTTAEELCAPPLLRPVKTGEPKQRTENAAHYPPTFNREVLSPSIFRRSLEKKFLVGCRFPSVSFPSFLLISCIQR